MCIRDSIKTLMLWACELKSRSWWTDDLNFVRICVELLRTLAVWLIDAHCQHYFINNCNCFDQFENLVTANRLMSVNRALFSEWCIHSYIYINALSFVAEFQVCSSTLHL